MTAAGKKDTKVRKRRLAVLLALLVAGIGSGGYLLAVGGRDAAMRADPDDPELVALGREVYDARCAACHGRNLEGQPNWRQRLPDGGFPAPPHDASGHTWHHPDAFLFEVTRAGGQALAPPGFKSNMPAFGDVLSEREIWAVLSYIKSRWPDSVRRRQAEVDRRMREGGGR